MNKIDTLRYFTRLLLEIASNEQSLINLTVYELRDWLKVKIKTMNLKKNAFVVFESNATYACLYPRNCLDQITMIIGKNTILMMKTLDDEPKKRSQHAKQESNQNTNGTQFFMEPQMIDSCTNYPPAYMQFPYT